jgi:hypothetical protein
MRLKYQSHLIALITNWKEEVRLAVENKMIGPGQHNARDLS